MTKVLDWLKGKKTYLVGLAVIVWGLYQHFFGAHLTLPEVIDFIFGGAGLMTIRAALAKIGLDK